MSNMVSRAAARRWTDLLIESDRRYFAAGATLHRLPGGHLAVMPGLANIAAGAVALIDAPAALLVDPTGWRDAALAVCASEDAIQLRFYTPAADVSLSRAISSARFSSAEEIAMVGEAVRLASGDGGADEGWTLREVTTESLWQVKQRLHDLTPERPDGKAVDSMSWVRLERAKVAAGYMSAWIIERDGEACGTFGLSYASGMVRFKNFFVAPEHRDRGAASVALRLIARQALSRRIDAVGCFVLPGSRGERLYGRAGFMKVGRQMEWIAAVTAGALLERRPDRNAVG